MSDHTIEKIITSAIHTDQPGFFAWRNRKRDIVQNEARSI